MNIRMVDLQKALDVLRRVESYDQTTAQLGDLGRLRAAAACARIDLEVSIGRELVEVES